MKIDVLGKIKFMSEPKLVKSSDGSEHTFMTIWMKTLDETYIAINCWDKLIEKTKTFELGDNVNLECKLESHRNKKNPLLFYHKILLR